jgi:hypothetical protein
MVMVDGGWWMVEMVVISVSIEAIITLTERRRLLAIVRRILYKRIFVGRNAVTVSNEISNKNALADNKLYRQIARHTATCNRKDSKRSVTKITQ